MSFYFFEPSYHKNNGMLRNQPYHSNHFERTIAPNAFMNNYNNRQGYPYMNSQIIITNIHTTLIMIIMLKKTIKTKISMKILFMTYEKP